MKRILLISSLLLTLTLVWKLWTSGSETRTRDEEHRQPKTTARTLSDDSEKSSTPAQKKSTTSPWSRASRPAKVGEPMPATAGTQSDELKARRLAEQLGLSGETLERLMPLLIDYAEKERLATKELLDQSPSLSNAEFINALVQRAGLSLTDSELRNQLNEEQWRILDEFDAAQESNTLNILANRKFEKWKHSIDFGDAEQEAFELFYHDWQERLQLAYNGNLTTTELGTQLSTQDNRMLEKLTALVPEDQIEKIRIIQEAANDPALKNLRSGE